MKNDTKLIAFYLPQYHPIPENDEWWGKGFTEWTNTAKAKPLFKGHYQPHIPADLGFYDLRVPETRIAQAEMAKEYGIEAFCYYHYWFGGKMLLERPLMEVIESGKPDFPFCVCWANQTWSGIWHGCPDKILMEQTYPGQEDYKNHFYYLLKAFSDSRYVTVEGKPLLLIYRPLELPNPIEFTDCWRDLAIKAGLKGLHIVGVIGDSAALSFVPKDFGMDAAIISSLPKRLSWASKRTPVKWLNYKIREFMKRPQVYSYEHDMPSLLIGREDVLYYPNVIHSWDNTPRSGSNGIVLHGATPELFQKNLKSAIASLGNYNQENRIIFLKSWNEWAEGNHLEPDMQNGLGFLKVIKDEITNFA